MEFSIRFLNKFLIKKLYNFWKTLKCFIHISIYIKIYKSIKIIIII